MMRRLALVFAILLVATACSQAGTIVLNWPEQNAGGDVSYPYVFDAGSQSYSVPSGESVLGAVFTSTLGNSGVQSTAVMDVYVNSVLVGSCPDTTAPCWVGGGPYPFTDTFLPGDLAALAGGSADLTITQNACCVIRLGASTLTITTGVSGTPEPATLSLLGLGLCGLAFMSRRLRRG